MTRRYTLLLGLELVWKHGKIVFYLKHISGSHTAYDKKFSPIVTWDVTISDSFAASHIKIVHSGCGCWNCGYEKDGKIRGVDPNLSVRATCLRGHWSLKRKGGGCLFIYLFISKFIRHALTFTISISKIYYIVCRKRLKGLSLVLAGSRF